LLTPADGDNDAALHGVLTALSRTLTSIGDAWSLLLLREAFLGNQTFDSLQKALGIPRQTLQQRLTRLCASQILQRVPYQERPRRYRYQLTADGRALHVFALAIWRWQTRWYSDNRALPAELMHDDCGRRFFPDFRCRNCGDIIQWTDVAADGPAKASKFRRPSGRNPRWIGNTKNRAALPAALLSPGTYILGDQWSCLIIAASFFGVCHFDRFVDTLTISTNILSTRLAALQEAGMFMAPAYDPVRRVFDYRQTEKCRSFLPVLVSLLEWGRTRRGSEAGAQARLRHTACGAPLAITASCNACDLALGPTSVQFRHHKKV